MARAHTRNRGQAVVYTRDEMIERIEEYILNHLSVKHPAYSNLPPCPFAKTELERNTIAYIFADLRLPSSFIVELEEKTTDTNSTVILVHEGKYLGRHLAEGYCDDLLVLWARRNPTLFRSSKTRLDLIPVHPEYDTRSKLLPFFYVLVQKSVILKQAIKSLKKMGWYDKFGKVDVLAESEEDHLRYLIHYRLGKQFMDMDFE